MGRKAEIDPIMSAQRKQLDKYFARTTREAAEAGQAAMDFILSLDPNISWKLNKATIDFRAERQFCSLWPVKNHITFWITKTDDVQDPNSRLKGEGRTTNLKLYKVSDFDDELKNIIRASYKSEGLRPLKN